MKGGKVCRWVRETEGVEFKWKENKRRGRWRWFRIGKVELKNRGGFGRREEEEGESRTARVLRADYSPAN